MPETIKLKVTVTDIFWPRPTDESDWYSIGTDQGKASGNIAWRPDPGERLLLEGHWGAYRGARVFKFSAAMVDIPEHPKAKLAYVCDRASGVGPAMQHQIWELWGEGWEQDMRASQIPRFSGKVYQSFTETLDLINSDAEKGRTIAWLMDKGATMAMANAAWSEWENDAVGIVQHNCYRLADLPNFGFQNVDREVRKHFGIEDGDPRRIHAGIIYALRQLTSNGNTLTGWKELHSEAIRHLGGAWREDITEQTRQMFKDEDLKGFPESQNIALNADYWNELVIWQFVLPKEEIAS